jgi:hypothetical protein
MLRLPAASLIVKPSPVYDPKALAAMVYAIGEHGVERPFLVDPELAVLSRHEEAGACRLLNLPEVPVCIVDVDALAKGDKLDAELNSEEIVLVGTMVEAVLQPIALQHRTEGQRKGHASRAGQAIETMERAEKVVVRKQAAASLGLSTTTYARIRDVVLASREDPEHFGDMVELLERTSPAAAHAELRRRQKQLKPPVEPTPERQAKGSTVRITAGKGPVQVIQSTLYSLQAAAGLLDATTAENLPVDLASSWADDLNDVVRSLGRFRSRLTELTKEHRNGQS